MCWRLLSALFSLFFGRASHLFFSRLQRSDFVRCLMGQAGLKQLWFRFLCCSTLVDAIIPLRTPGFIRLSARWSVYAIPRPPHTHTTAWSTQCRVSPCLFLSRRFSCSELLLEKMQVISLDRVTGWKITAGSRARRAARGPSLLYITDLAGLHATIRAGIRPGFISCPCESLCAGVREQSWPVCLSACETVVPLWYYNPSTLSIFCYLHARLKGRVRWSSPAGTRVIDSL